MDVASVQAESGVELLGRDDELAQLYAVIDGIGRRGGALVVRGEAGIGKSALLEAASARAREREVTVVSTTGTEPRRDSRSPGCTGCSSRFSTCSTASPSRSAARSRRRSASPTATRRIRSWSAWRRSAC